MAKILIVAADISSLPYAERLMKVWQKDMPQDEFWGVGGMSMEPLGFRFVGHAEEMTVVGFSEVIEKYQVIKKVFQKIVTELDLNPPSVAILLDYPGFNIKLARELHRRKIPVVYYISPQVWAWKKNRLSDIKKYVTRMIVVLPFEQKFYSDHGYDVDYFGHPLLDEIQPEYKDRSWQLTFRERMGIPRTHHVIGLMPGSRKGELDRHLDIQIEVARELYKKNSNITIMVLVAPNFTKEEISDRLGELRIPYVLLKDDPFKMISLTDIVLVASGTATLMVGLLEKPMVIMYKMSWITAQIARRVVRGYFGLVNIIAGKQIVPEIFQEDANVKHLTEEIQNLLTHEALRDAQIAELRQLKNSLGQGNVAEKVVQRVREFCK